MKRLNLSRKQIILSIGLAIVLVGGGVFAYQQVQDDETVADNPGQLDGADINYDPPTEEEKAQTEKHKEDITGQTQQESQTTSSGKKQVNVVITNTNQSDQDITVIAYVQGVFEDGGTCTATFTKGTSKVTKTSEAFADASTTNCAPFIIQRSEFASSGDWQLVVTYSSASAEGSSKPKTITLN